MQAGSNKNNTGFFVLLLLGPFLLKIDIGQLSINKSQTVRKQNK